MPAGRPKKSKKEKQSEVISAKITIEQKKKIIELYGSVKGFLLSAMDLLIKKEKSDG